MESPWRYPEPEVWFSEKTAEESDGFEEVREELAATDLGTLYVRRERVHRRFSKETEIKVI